jgi:hypothetical protein
MTASERFSATEDIVPESPNTSDEGFQLTRRSEFATEDQFTNPPEEVPAYNDHTEAGSTLSQVHTESIARDSQPTTGSSQISSKGYRILGLVVAIVSLGLVLNVPAVKSLYDYSKKISDGSDTGSPNKGLPNNTPPPPPELYQEEDCPDDQPEGGTGYLRQITTVLRGSRGRYAFRYEISVRKHEL